MYHFLGVVHDQQGYENGLILMPHGTGKTTVWKGWSQKKILFKEKHFWIIRNTTVQYLKIRILIVQNVIPKQKPGPREDEKILKL